MKVNQVIELTDFTHQIAELTKKKFPNLNIQDKEVRDILYQFQDNLKKELIRLSDVPTAGSYQEYRHVQPTFTYHIRLNTTYNRGQKQQAILLKITKPKPRRKK